jgi:hypothetical protein
MHVRFAIHEFISRAMSEKVCTEFHCDNDTQKFFFLCANKNRFMEENAYVNFCPRLQLVSNLQISEIAHKFEIGELVSN